MGSIDFFKKSGVKKLDFSEIKLQVNGFPFLFLPLFSFN